MSTRRIALAGVLTASAIVASTRTAAAQTCWDFATLDQTHQYRIGEIFIAPTATIEMKNYLWNGNKIVSPAAVGYATQTQIAGGPAPEFRLYLINAHIVPDTPVDHAVVPVRSLRQRRERRRARQPRGERRAGRSDRPAWRA